MFMAILLNLVFRGLLLLGYPALLTQPGSTLYVLEPSALLTVYAGLVGGITRHPGPRGQRALRVGTQVGLCAGGLWIC